MFDAMRSGLEVGLGFVVAALLAAGCGSGGSSGPVTGGVGAAGGSVASADGVAVLQVPAGALEADTEIHITRTEEATPGLEPSSAVFRFVPEGLTFAQAATVTFTYDPAKLAPGASPQDVQVFWTDGAGSFGALASTVNAEAHTVTAKVTHFSLGVAAVQGGGGTGCCAGAEGHTTVEGGCPAGTESVEEKLCAEVCCRDDKGLSMKPAGDCVEVEGRALPKLLEKAACASVCCKTATTYASMRSQACAAASGQEVEAGLCVTICCSTSGAVVARGICLDAGASSSDILPTDQCDPLCCGTAEEVWSSFRAECAQDGGTEKAAAGCEDACCQEGGDLTVRTRGTCGLRSGVVVAIEECSKVCCHQGNAWTLMDEQKCSEAGGTAEIASECADVCCLDKGSGTLRPAGACDEQGGSPADVDACDAVCCGRGPGYLQDIRQLCLEDGGKVLALEECSPVCCFDGVNHAKVPKQACADGRAKALPEVDCDPVCCLHQARFEELPAAQCIMKGGDVQKKTAPCDPVCCAHDGAYEATSRGACEVLGGVEALPEVCDCLDAEGHVPDCTAPPQGSTCLQGPGSCEGGACVFPPVAAGSPCASADACGPWTCDGKGACVHEVSCPAPKSACLEPTCNGGQCGFVQKAGVECSPELVCAPGKVCNPTTCLCEDVTPPLSGGGSASSSFSAQDCVGGVEAYDIQGIGTLDAPDSMPIVMTIDATVSAGPICAHNRSALYLRTLRDGQYQGSSKLMADLVTPLTTGSDFEMVGICRAIGGGGPGELTFSGPAHTQQYDVMLLDASNPGCCFDGNATSTASGSIRFFEEFGTGHPIGTTDFHEVVTRGMVGNLEPLYVPLFKSQGVTLKFRSIGFSKLESGVWSCSESQPFHVFYDGHHVGNDVVVRHVTNISAQGGLEAGGTQWCVQTFSAPETATYVIFLGTGATCLRGLKGEIPNELFEWSVKVQ